MIQGWIKLHRGLVENPYMRKPAYRAVWVELLLRATYNADEVKSVIFCGKRIFLKPGQLTCGEKQLSQWTGVSRGTVHRILETFKNEHQIEHQTSNQFSLITVLNWQSYQGIGQQNEQPVNNSRTTSEQPVNTLKESKNIKNERKEENTSQVFEEDSKEFSLSKLLLDQILAVNHRFKKPDLQKWCAEIDKMIRIDERSVEEIEALILWISTDPFWRSNILSTAKLRQRFDQVWMKAQSSHQLKKPTYTVIP